MMLPFVLAAMIAASDTCNHPPSLVKQGAIEYPDDADLLGPGLLEVIVKVTIDENGKATKVDVIESSGYDTFDNVVIHSLETSTYDAAEVACSPSTSYFLYVEHFMNKYINDNGEITPPTFTFPDGWNPVKTVTTLPDGMNTVAEFDHGDEHVLITSQHPRGDFDGKAATDTMLDVLGLHPVAVQSGSMTICSGFQSAWSTNFEYADGAQTRTAELIDVQGANGLFSLFYSTPKGAAPDDAIDKAIERFCVQGAPRATPPDMGMPVG